MHTFYHQHFYFYTQEEILDSSEPPLAPDIPPEVIPQNQHMMRPIQSSPSVTEPAPMIPEDSPSSPGPLGRSMSRLNTMSTRGAETVGPPSESFSHLNTFFQGSY